jgi:hypothetical protein
VVSARRGQEECVSWAAVGIDVLIAVALGVVGLGLYVHRPSSLVLLAVPASFLVRRIGGASGGNNISFSDLFLFVGSLGAIPLVDWRNARRLKVLLTIAAFYLATELFSVLDHPNRYDLVEWIHEILLVCGAAIVGFVIVDRDQGRAALESFVVIATVLSAWTSVLFALHGLHAIGPLPFHFQKNLLGDLFAVAVLVAFLNPPWAGLTPRWTRVEMYVCLCGLIAVQSRQAMIALIVAIAAVVIRDRRTGHTVRRNRPKVLLLALIPVALVVYVTLAGQVAANSQHSSISQRTLWYSQSLHLWSQYPFFGVGERFWYTNLYGLNFQPPNAEISQLATGGVVGLLGLMTLLVGSLWLLARLPAEVGSLAFGVVVGHVVEGQFDIFWVSPSGSLPWIVAGMGLAAATRVDGSAAAVRVSSAGLRRVRPTGRT